MLQDPRRRSSLKMPKKTLLYNPSWTWQITLSYKAMVKKSLSSCWCQNHLTLHISVRRTWRGCYRAGTCAKRWSRLIPLQQRKWIIVWLALNKAGSLVQKDNLKGRMWRRGKTTLCPRHDATSMRDVNSISTTMVIQPNNAEKQHKTSGFIWQFPGNAWEDS